MYTTLRTEQKMTADPDATKEETYYNSESEGKEYKDYDEKYDAYIQATCEETFGQECYDKEFWEDYTQNTAEKKNNSEET